MLLEVQNLGVSYGSVVAVNDVSLRIEEGRIVTVLGANGAGKTSLLNAIMGLTRARGSIRLDGKTVSGLSAGRRVASGIALVPEGRRILLSLTVEENLQMGAYQRRDSAIAVDIDRMYGLFPNLARRRHQPGSVLSGGEQQMLAIGRALMARPRLLLLDEPSLGLSPLFVSEIFNLIRSLNSTGLAVLLVEQNTRMALKTAGYGYVLRLGRLLTEATTAELMKSGELTKAYLGGDTAGISSVPAQCVDKEMK
jgi:branched-chain amino acid transport system ATP-binding protein